MNRPIKIKILGEPIAKKRPRFTVRGKGPNQYVHVYSDQDRDSIMFEKQVKYSFNQQQRKRFDKETPLKVVCRFYLKRPLSHYGTGMNAGKLKENAPKYHLVKPDIDNLEKFVLDCLNGVVWADDKQIVSTVSDKIYIDDEPYTEILIFTLNEGE